MKRFLLALLLVCVAAEAHAQAVGLGNEASAGALSTTDTIPICQFGPGGCPTGNTSQKLKAATGSQLSAFIAAQGFALLASPTFTGTPAAPTAACSTANTSTQIATIGFAKGCLFTVQTVSWVVGGTPANGVLMGRPPVGMTITNIVCHPTVSADAGASIDVYYAPSGTGGTGGTKINSTASCNPAGSVNVDQQMLSGSSVNIPANNTVYLVGNGAFANSAGSVSAQMIWQ